jgi:EmrB/QacA subfamily drug resistance transporter
MGAVSQRVGTLVAVILGSTIVFLDGTVVNVALETIGRELPSTLVGRLEGLTYVNSGYLAVLAALLVLAGALNDYYGRRRMFRVGLAGFGAASVACGLAPTMEVLIAARLVQGAFGALLVPGSLSIITATFSGEDRGRVIGLWAAASSGTTTLGPLVGGFLVQSLTWRAAFLINVPLVLVALYATTAVLESRDTDAQGDFDWLGAAVVAIGIGGLAFGATRGQERSWQDAPAFVALAIGAVATLAFPILMRVRPHLDSARPFRIGLAKPSHPLVPLSLFGSRNFTVVNLSTFVIYGALYVSFTFQGLFFQGTIGYTPLAAGAVGLPIGVMLTFLSTPAGQLAGRVGPRIFMTVGPILMGAGLLWLARVPADSAPWLADASDPATLAPSGGLLVDVLPGMLLFGLGISLVVAPLTTALMSSIPVRNAGIGSAINNAVSRVGSPLVSAVLFIAITATFYPSLASRVPGLNVDSPEVRSQVEPLTSTPDNLDPALAEAAREASTDAFHLAMLVSALLCLAGAAINGIGIRNPRPEEAAAAAERVTVAG